MVKTTLQTCLLSFKFKTGHVTMMPLEMPKKKWLKPFMYNPFLPMMHDPILFLYPNTDKHSKVLLLWFTIWFTMKHWGIHKNDTYITDIINIQVIILPRHSLTPHKRKVILTDPFSSKAKKSPTKKKPHDWLEGSL